MKSLNLIICLLVALASNAQVDLSEIVNRPYCSATLLNRHIEQQLSGWHLSGSDTAHNMSRITFKYIINEDQKPLEVRYISAGNENVGRIIIIGPFDAVYQIYKQFAPKSSGEAVIKSGSAYVFIDRFRVSMSSSPGSWIVDISQR
jgi:hypothetical protein